MLYQNRARRQVPVDHGLLAHTGFMEFTQRQKRFPSETQARTRIPRIIGGALLDGRRGGIGDGKEPDLARVSRRILKRIDDARRPSIQLQPLQRLPLPFSLLRRLRGVVGRKVVKIRTARSAHQARRRRAKY